MKLTELKGDIAGCIPDYGQSIDPDFAAKSAKAILDLITARLHECVKPLEWQRTRCDETKIHPEDRLWLWTADKYTIEEYDYGYVWLCFDEDEVEVRSETDVILAAKAAAQAHYAAQIIAGLDL